MRLIILRQEQPTSEGSIVFGISRRDPRITYAVSSQTSFAWHIACSADAVLARRVLTVAAPGAAAAAARVAGGACVKFN